MKVEFTITVLNTFYCLEYMVDQIVLPRNMFTDVGNYEDMFTDVENYENKFTDVGNYENMFTDVGNYERK